MPTYIAFVNWTDQGIRNVKDTVQRRDGAAELAQKYGSSLQLYWIMGPYDLVAIIEAPDDKSASAFVLEVGSGSSVRTTMTRAYDRDEMSEIIEKLD